MKKQNLKSKNTNHKKTAGITLIALVVTIIVLLILAGISIMMLSGNNGILTRAGEAKEGTGIAQTEEQVKLATSAALADGLGTISYTNLNNELKAEFGEEKYDIDPKNDAESWTVTVNEQAYTISSIGKVEVTNVKIKLSIAGEKVIIPPKPDLAAFESSEVTKIDNEYVIMDNKGNEFVWIPVEKNQKITLSVESKEDIKLIVLYNPMGEKIVEEANKGINYTTEIETFGNENCINGEYRAEVQTESGKVQKHLIVRSLYAVDAINDYFKTDKMINSFMELMGVKDKAELYALCAENGISISNEDELGAFLSKVEVGRYKDETEEKDGKSYTLHSNSVNENGGFYIGRYEAGKEGETLVCKAGVDPYVDVTRDQAIELAKNMYAEKSDLLTGAAWDRTMDWIINQNDRSLTVNDIIANSKSWGNYSYSNGSFTASKTGTLGDYTKVNNIYDLAGNVFEWSSEKYMHTSNYACCRGGGVHTMDKYSRAAERDEFYYGYHSESIRFPCLNLLVGLILGMILGTLLKIIMLVRKLCNYKITKLFAVFGFLIYVFFIGDSPTCKIFHW